MRSPKSRELTSLLGWIAVITNVACLALPVVIVPVMIIVTPGYFQPMVHEPLGLLLLSLGIVVFAAGCGASYLAVRMVRTGRPLWAVLIAVAITFLVTFPVLWVVLLGPAILILMRPA